LYNTPSLLPIKEILSHIPAEFERVRVMRLKAGTTIKKHTDKVDKEIKNKNIIRIHVPLRTSVTNVHFYLWEGKKEEVYHLETGKYYYTDVTKPHAVHNKWTKDRLHLVVDCYNNPKISSLIDQTKELDDMDWQYT
jgi:aspartyl/asparaginyl beta-hydroxylase (cupin superfamily)